MPCAAGRARDQGLSGASPARSSARRTPGATDNTSPRSRRSGGLHPPSSGPARPEHRPAAASRRSLQACIASLPLQSSLMSKTYLKSDHFNGGGSIPCLSSQNFIRLKKLNDSRPFGSVLRPLNERGQERRARPLVVGCWAETGSDAGKVFLRASSSASSWRLRLSLSPSS